MKDFVNRERVNTMFKTKNNISKKYNTETQYYKDIPIKLIVRGYADSKAYRFALNDTSQNVWIPKKHLEEDGTLKPDENIDYVFRKSQNQLAYAGIWKAIIGIKRKTDVSEHIEMIYNGCKDSWSNPVV